jgi:hypothetical protein
MRRFFNSLHASLPAATVIAALLLPSYAQAITYGFPDPGNALGNVGAFIVEAPDGSIYPICSGTLIAPSVFLTASHCTAYFQSDLEPLGYGAFVSFDNPIPFAELTSGTTHLIAVTQVVTNPKYNQRQSDSGDIAVLIVPEEETIGITPAALPAARLLAQLAARNGLKRAVFTAAGYGLQNRVVGGGQPFFNDLNPVPRMYAFSAFNALNGGYLRLSQNPATGNAGTCFGDSGGPDFLQVGNQPVLVAITIAGDAVCRSTNVDYRLDTPSARQFLSPYVTLP